MVAVAALAAAIDGRDVLERVAIGTTPWVAFDPAADVPALTREVDAALPLMVADLNFGRSRHPGLRQYQQFLVKEGVGAGGACIAALLASGASVADLHDAIDRAYDVALGARSAEQPFN
jgi:NaMN:DMB phosphoribosyltransferase